MCRRWLQCVARVPRMGRCKGVEVSRRVVAFAALRSIARVGRGLGELGKHFDDVSDFVRHDLAYQRFLRSVTLGRRGARDDAWKFDAQIVRRRCHECLAGGDDDYAVFDCGLPLRAS